MSLDSARRVRKTMLEKREIMQILLPGPMHVTGQPILRGVQGNEHVWIHSHITRAHRCLKTCHRIVVLKIYE